MKKMLSALVLWLALANAAQATLAKDGATYSTSVTGLTLFGSITTTNTNDTIVLFAYNSEGNAVVSVADTALLTWHKRQAMSWDGVITEEWYAFSSAALTSDVVTVTYGASTGGNCRLFMVGVNGTNTSTPFDTNGSLPAQALTSTGTTVSVTGISTNNANTFLVGNFRCTGGAFSARPAGFSQVISDGAVTDFSYLVVSAQQSSASFQWTCSGSGFNALLFDALQAPGGGASPVNLLLDSGL